jgi:putative ABC transport system permease protein
LLRRAVRDVDPSLPIISLQTFAQYLDSNLDLWLVRAGAAMFSIFGGLALALAVVGLYGVKAYSVARRTREIGIRMALGAQRRDVVAMVMRQGIWLATIGAAVGLLLAAGAGQALVVFLFGVPPLDPAVFGAAAALFAIVGLVACYLPARRATSIDPQTALRYE